MKSLYASLFVVDEDTLCLSVNGKEFILDGGKSRRNPWSFN